MRSTSCGLSTGADHGLIAYVSAGTNPVNEICWMNFRSIETGFMIPSFYLNVLKGRRKSWTKAQGGRIEHSSHKARHEPTYFSRGL
jgi:hypothetical protein